jgi:WD40 repeat protein
VLAAGADNTLYLWDAASGELRWSQAWPGQPVLDLSFRPDGTAFVVTDGSDQAIVLDSAAGQAVLSIVLPELARAEGTATNNDLPPQGRLIGASYSPDGARLATASIELGVQLWDADNGELLFTLAESTSPSTSAVSALRYGSNGRHIITGSTSGVGQLYLAQLRDLQRLAADVSPRELTAAERQSFLGIPPRPPAASP